LSELTDAQIDSLYPHESLTPLTQKTVATRTELKKELEQIRKTGVAFQSEENRNGVEAVACVIRDVAGTAVAAMSIATPVFMTNQARREQLATIVRLGASLVSYRLGYQDAVNPVRSIEEIRAWWEQNQKVSTPQDISKR